MGVEGFQHGHYCILHHLVGVHLVDIVALDELLGCEQLAVGREFECVAFVFGGICQEWQQYGYK